MSRVLRILVGILLAWWLLMAIISVIVGKESRALWFSLLFLVGVSVVLWRRRSSSA